MPDRVVVLGLDGADANTLGEHLKRGRAPNLTRIISSGASAPLPSTVLPITPSAWSAALTGLNPGKTGVLTFERRTETYRTRLVNAADLGDRLLLSWLPKAGKPTICIGFPMTTPAPPGAGVIVAGWDSSPGTPICNVGRWAAKAAEVGYKLEDEFSADAGVLEHHVRAAFRLAACIAAGEPWNCLLLYLGFIDSLGHRLGNGNAATAHLLDVVDEEIGGFAPAAGNDTAFLACSDHGFGTFDRSFSAIQWLDEHGYLSLRSRSLRGSKNGAIPGVEIMDLDGGLVDWTKTRAFCYEAVGSTLGIRLNVRGSYPAGTVAPADAWQLAEELRANLLAARDPVDGSPLVKKVLRREEAFWGPYVHEFPELIVRTAADTVAYVAKRRAVDAGYELEPGFVHRGRFDSHLDDGIWLSSFPIDGAPRIEDVAPTVCALLGVSAPSGADGANRARSVLPVASAQAVAATVGVSPYTEEEEEIVRRRLEALGYL